MILERIHKACAAFEKGDVDYLLEFLDETFTLTDTRGQVTTREQNLAKCASASRATTCSAITA